MAEDGIADFGLGDWCPPEGNQDMKTPAAITDTAYFYADSVVLAKIAALLGDEERAEAYEKQAAEIRAAFHARFVDSEQKKVGPNTQTALACALYQGLAYPDETGWILAQLIAEIEKCHWHLDFGILGAKYVLHSLTEHGRADVAYAIAAQKTYPSWGYWIAQGATTLWEDWQGEASRNHHMFSDISAWFYKGLAGINPDPDQPGFKHIIIRPNPVGDLAWVRCWHESLYGKIVCNWRRKGDQFLLQLEIPANSHATVLLPVKDPAQVTESGKPIAQNDAIAVAGQQGERLACKLPSGSYEFTVENFTV
jgi:alpha-L-rhamnosidase